jgi:gluconate kinase
MPASLLASQCSSLERPTAEERPVTIDVASPPESLAAVVVAALRRPD